MLACNSFLAVQLHVIIANIELYIGTYNSELEKIVYLDNRRYLPEDSSLRMLTEEFPSKKKELRSAPPKRNFNNMINYHKAADNAK